MFLVQCSNLKIIDHKFFEPGHSYMECDRSFGQIEKQKKKSMSVFIPEHWSEVIRQTSKNFNVVNMTCDFVSFSCLGSMIMDPKKDVDKNLLRWRDIVWFGYRQEEFLSFLFKSTRNPDFPFSQSEKCSALKKGRPNFKITDLNKKLYAATLKISYDKWENLNQLLPFVPPIHHEYYTSLPHENKTANKKSQCRQKKQNKKSKVDNIVTEENMEFDYSRVELDSDYDE